MIKRETLQVPGLLAGSTRFLRRPKAGDLRPDIGTGCAVVMEQCVGKSITGQQLIVAEESIACTRATEPLEVHGQKGHIGTDVGVTQSVRELNAVEDPDPVVKAEDVFGL